MNALRQIFIVTLMSLQTLPQRFAPSLAVVIGIAGVVGVLVSMLALAAGMANSFTETGRADRAIVLLASATAEAGSFIPRNNVATVMNAPGVARTPDGKPIASADAVFSIKLKNKDDGATAWVTMRGIGPEAMTLRPEIKLIEGRMFQPALREVIVGARAQGEYAGLNVGDVLKLRNADWAVVGKFESGNSLESGLLTDAETAISAYQRTTVQSVTVKLESPAAFQAFKDALTTNTELQVSALSEAAYYAAMSNMQSGGMRTVGLFVGTIMGVGALFAALNVMFSAVSSRLVEIATLRAIGFGAGPVVVSVMAEALLLGLAGGVVGAGLAAAIFNGMTMSTLMAYGNAQAVFSAQVTPGVLGLGLGWALAIGLVGGLFPAVRAARLPVAAALQVK